jgi:hypothetical protein
MLFLGIATGVEFLRAIGWGLLVGLAAIIKAYVRLQAVCTHPE